jgi:hypothetical protein
MYGIGEFGPQLIAEKSVSCPQKDAITHLKLRPRARTRPERRKAYETQTLGAH